ncbi:hypothetical protein TNCV_4197601 [Trichonephila clavipes]|nr:hypothetical protein TNCV_4197601 [Trichonephila clavipes]
MDVVDLVTMAVEPQVLSCGWWEASDHPQSVLPLNCGGTEPKRTVTCMVLKATANDRRHLALCHEISWVSIWPLPIRKFEAAAVTVDISQLPGKNCLVRQAQMIWTRLFCEEEESISNPSHSEEESMEILKEKPLTLDEKLESNLLKTKVLY